MNEFTECHECHECNEPTGTKPGASLDSFTVSAWTGGPGPHTLTGPGEARGLSLARPGPGPGSGDERLTSPSEAGARIEASLLPRPLPCSTVRCPLSGQRIKLSSDL